MASKFNFTGIARGIQRNMPTAMREIAEVSRDEFVSNFDNQSFDGKAWAPLTYRKEPPPKLELTGQLKRNTEKSIKSVTWRRCVLENTSIDDRGRSYAAYHNNGTEYMPARPIMLHTLKLEAKQLRILKVQTGRAWHRV